MREDKNEMPRWIRYLLIVAVVLYLLWILFIKSGVQREDFPFF